MSVASFFRLEILFLMIEILQLIQKEMINKFTILASSLNMWSNLLSKNDPFQTFEMHIKSVLFLFKQILDRGPEHRVSKLTVLCLLIIIILIS